MNWRELTNAYYERFEESVGVPFGGFPDEKTEREYLETLEQCLELGKPLTQEQRKRFFPLEFQDIPAETQY
jgi:hypothetical protein